MLNDSDYSGWPLVARALEIEPGNEVIIGSATKYVHWAGVRNIRKQRSETDHKRA